MPPLKQIFQAGEAIITSPAVQSGLQAATRAGAKFFDEFFTLGTSAARGAAGTAGEVASGTNSARSLLARNAEALARNPKDDKAVLGLINSLESPVQQAAAKTFQQMKMPFTESHRTAMTELVQDRVLSTRLSMLKGEITAGSGSQLQRHLALSIKSDFKSTVPNFLKGDAAATPHNAGLLRGQSASPLDSVIAKDRVRLLERGLSNLPARRAEALDLRYFEGLNRSETAARMGITPTRVDQLEAYGLRGLHWSMKNSVAPILTRRSPGGPVLSNWKEGF